MMLRLYFLGCNWQKLPKLIKYFKEHSVGARKAKISEDYVAICKPGQNFISTIEKCQSSPHGYALRRGVLWRTTFAIECERRIPAPEFSKFVRLQTQTPPGWPPDPEDEKEGYKRSINLGNTCTKEQFDIICAQLYKLLVVFLDVRTHKGGPRAQDVELVTGQGSFRL